MIGQMLSASTRISGRVDASVFAGGDNMLPVQHTLDTPYVVGPVHCYSTELAGELVLFDTGPPTEEAKQVLTNTLDLPRLKHVVVTHCHIDHYGLSRWLEQETDAVVYLPFRDHLKITRHEQRLEQLYELMIQLGFDRDFLVNLHSNMQDGSVFPTLPESYRIVEEDLPEHLGLEALSCPGHSQSDLVLVGDNWAVTGDVMLRGIFQTPLLDVDLLTEQRFRNYDAYCDSLIKLAGLRNKEILPGHRETIDSVDGCILFYVGKLLERTRRVAGLPRGLSVAELVARLFGTGHENPFVTYLKASEVVFIRDFLVQPERLQNALEQIGLLSGLENKFARLNGY